MAKKDYLVQLIKTLSPTDKRNFILYSNILPGDKKYLRLYETLQAQGQYDATQLCKALNWQPKQLTDQKYYLGQVILKSIRNFDEDIAIQTRVTKDFIDAQILYDRGMTEHALAAFEKILEQARYFEILAFIPMLLTSKRSCLYLLRRMDQLAAIDKEIQLSMAANVEFNALWNFCSLCFDMDIKRNSAQAIGKLKKHPILKQQPAGLKTLKAAACLLAAEQRIDWMINDKKELLKSARKSAAFYLANPRLLDIDPYIYIASQTGAAQAEVQNGNYNRGLQALQQAEKLLKPIPKYLSAAHAKTALYFVLHTRTWVWRITGKYHDAAALGQQLYNEDYGLSIFERYDLIFELALALLQAGKPNDAYKKLDELVQMKEEVWGDLQPYTRIALIMCQMQRGNYDAIPYLIRNVKAWLKRQKINNPEFELLLSHLYAISKATTTQRATAWSNLNKIIEAGQLDEFDKKFNGLKHWVSMQL